MDIGVRVDVVQVLRRRVLPLACVCLSVGLFGCLSFPPSANLPLRKSHVNVKLL